MKNILLWGIATISYILFYGMFVNYLGDLYFENKIKEGILILLTGILLIPAWFGIRATMTAISDKIKEND
jgi:hypothetical protein